ncbi:hypothetical protein JAAARDRAFT_200467 [Jaapia argillacea MUCL 33604]|uniref:Uncharacterized protein n=1 Tax=Jaapia argillacea MUCL 33604 TaxID=933084 RepID=A0A067P7U1_9AGAM|nr:hypothetical protein JAAARDRAFT_200467 [Jaapia argillacea MUCL 33604]
MNWRYHWVLLRKFRRQLFVIRAATITGTELKSGSKGTGGRATSAYTIHMTFNHEIPDSVTKGWDGAIKRAKKGLPEPESKVDLSGVPALFLTAVPRSRSSVLDFDSKGKGKPPATEEALSEGEASGGSESSGDECTGSGIEGDEANESDSSESGGDVPRSVTPKTSGT